MKKTSELIWQDTQHQKLFELIEALKLPHVGAEIFTQLLDYAEQHFTLEEAYMRQLEYPNIKAHIASHNQFRAELKDMVESMDSFDDLVRESVSIFLKEWLSRHVFGIDKDLESFILQSKAK